MKNNRFLYGMVSLALAAVICFIAIPTLNARTNGKTEIVRVTDSILKGEQITDKNTEVIEVGGYNLPANVAKTKNDVVGKYAAVVWSRGIIYWPQR